MFDVVSIDVGFREAKFIPFSVVQFTNFSSYFFLRKCILSKCKHFVGLFTKFLLLLQLHLGWAGQKASCVIHVRRILGLVSVLKIGARRRPGLNNHSGVA